MALLILYPISQLLHQYGSFTHAALSSQSKTWHSILRLGIRISSARVIGFLIRATLIVGFLLRGSGPGRRFPPGGRRGCLALSGVHHAGERIYGSY